MTKKLILFTIIISLLPTITWATIEVAYPSGVETYSDVTEVSDTEARFFGSSNIAGKIYFRLATVYPPPIFCKEVYGSNMIFTKETSILVNQKLGLKATGLRPSTKYFFCAIVSTANKIYYGDVEGPFTILASGCDNTAKCPVVEVDTLQATFVKKGSATIAGNFQTTEPIDLWFEYGKNAGLANAKKTTIESISFSSAETVSSTMKSGTKSKALSGLDADTKYYFQIAAKNKKTGEDIRGNILNFKTLALDTTEVVITTGPCLSDADCVAPATCQNGACLGPGGGTNDIPVCDIGCGGPGNQAYIDATVRSREGVEHVIYRQIRNKDIFLQRHGLEASDDKNAFALNLAHSLAIIFGYADQSRREVRVKYPDVAAYVLREFNNRLYIDEYFYNRLLGTRSPSFGLKSLRSYEYYFRKR